MVSFKPKSNLSFSPRHRKDLQIPTAYYETFQGSPHHVSIQEPQTSKSFFRSTVSEVSYVASPSTNIRAYTPKEISFESFLFSNPSRHRETRDELFEKKKINIERRRQSNQRTRDELSHQNETCLLGITCSK